MEQLESKNPSDGNVIGSVSKTPATELPNLLVQAREAQRLCSEKSLRQRSRYLLNLREVFLSHREEMIALIEQENGKPLFEALANEFIPTLSSLTYFAKKGRSVYRDQAIRLQLPFSFLRKSTLQNQPLGVVGVITPWNYPLFLSIGDIAMNLMAGNAILYKPSEVTPLVGQKIFELTQEAGLPTHVLQILHGDGSLGADLVKSEINKIFFTGSTKTGKHIAKEAARTLTPVSLELGGKDAMIVLADADLDLATSAALWGGFWNSGQNCCSVERLILHESIADSFVDQLQAKIQTLETHSNLGSITFEAQRKVYEKQMRDAEKHSLQILAGGKSKDRGNSFLPTLVQGKEIEKSSVYQEESFGPIIAITRFKSIQEAIEKCNDSIYGLTASIFSGNTSLAEEVSRKLEVGTVTVNEVGYTAGLSETPWGGFKSSGLGRKHGLEGMRECVQLRHVHQPRGWLPHVKSPWWFPYTSIQFEAFRLLSETFRSNPLERLKSLPLFLWHWVQTIKRDKRI